MSDPPTEPAPLQNMTTDVPTIVEPDVDAEERGRLKRQADDACVESDEDERRFRKRSAPPSRHRGEETDEGGAVRRQRSYPNLYREDRRDSKGEGEGEGKTHAVDIVNLTEASAAVPHLTD
ncbi:unnamed protein product [Alternaria alternata]